MATPLIEGLNPAEYNIASMNGGYAWKIMDGMENKTTYSSSMDPFLENEIGYLLINKNLGTALPESEIVEEIKRWNSFYLLG